MEELTGKMETIQAIDLKLGDNLVNLYKDKFYKINCIVTGNIIVGDNLMTVGVNGIKEPIILCRDDKVVILRD